MNNMADDVFHGNNQQPTRALYCIHNNTQLQTQHKRGEGGGGRSNRAHAWRLDSAYGKMCDLQF